MNEAPGASTLETCRTGGGSAYHAGNLCLLWTGLCSPLWCCSSPRHASGDPGGTVLIYGPMHLIVGMLVEGLAQGSRAGARAICRRLSPRAARLGQWGTFFALILLTTAFPFAFRAYSFADLRHRGRTQAEQDWNAGQAELYVKDPAVAGRVTHHFDPS